MSQRLVLLAVLALGALAGAGACAPDRASIQIQAICYPTEDCNTDGGCQEELIGLPFLAKGTVGSDTRLVVMLQVENQLPNNADKNTGRLNTNDAHVESAYIEGVGGAKSVPTNGLIMAGSTTTVLTWIPILSTEVLAEGYYTAQLKLRGIHDDNSSFETGEFPISFYYGTGAVTECPARTCPPGAVAQEPVVCMVDETEEPAAAKPTPR